MSEVSKKKREEIIAEAIGDGGNTTRGARALEALHRAGWSVQQPPADVIPLAISLRERGFNADADTVEEVAMELDRMRRGWGPTTPTERQLRHADLITARSYIEAAYASLIELNMSNYSHDDVQESNDGVIEAIQVIRDALGWFSDTFSSRLHGIPDQSYTHDTIAKITRNVSED
jgi:hypothetical protein